MLACLEVEPKRVAQSVQFAMGTVMSHRVFGNHSQETIHLVENEIAALEKRFSRYLPQSDISRINRAAGLKSVKIHPDTFEILRRSIEISTHCQGVFDVTIGPLVDLWKIGKEEFEVPKKSDIWAARSLVGFKNLELDPQNSTACLKYAGQSLDLGGIAKGLAADKIAASYRRAGVLSACSNLGGNVITIGSKPDGDAWNIGIQHPSKQNQLLGSVAVKNQSVVTSGGYQRLSRDRHGTCYHHILDPRTGFPAKTDLISVTIITHDALLADALATTIFLCGSKKGIKMMKQFANAQAILVVADESVLISTGLQEVFTPASDIIIAGTY